MKNQLYLTFFIFLFSYVLGIAQVDIQPNAIGINECNPLSELAVNTVGNITNAVTINSDFNGNGSAGLVAFAKDITNGNNFTSGVIGIASNFGGTPNKAIGIAGFSVRDIPYSSGRSYGARLTAGNSTAGANYGVLSVLVGGNAGAAVVGQDAINHPWGQVMPNNVSYAGYFRGKGYFHDNVGLGVEDPKSKLHVQGGDMYVQGSANGVILDSGTGCYKITVDGTGALITTSVPCP